jgi:WD40 repeat protein
MEHWINLFLKVSKPVLTTIVYTGINTWLDVFQEEITERHKQQVKNTVKSLIVKDNIPEQKLSSSESFSGSQKTHKRNDLEIGLSPEREEWTLRLSAQKLLEKAAKDGSDLLFFLAPPKKTFSEFSCLSFTPSDLEQRLDQNFREFLQKNYSLHVPNKRIGFIGGLWDHSRFFGETSIQLLFEQLNSISCLILETEIQGNEIKINLVYWKKAAQKYHYSTIFSFNYQSFLREAIKTRVKEWELTRNKLLQLGKSQEDLQRLGGICEQNYALVEELEVLAAEGIKTEDLKVNYQFDEQDYESLCQFLSICHCLLGGWVADIHYLIHENISPHLPICLLSLTEAFPRFHAQPSIFEVTVSLYEDILTVLGHESFNEVPELVLKLAESLMLLPDKSFAIEPLTYSFTCWRQQHQLPEIPSLERLKQICDTLSQRDREYLDHLRQCLSNLTENTQVNKIREMVEILIQPPTNIKSFLPQINQFQLQRTVTTIAEKILGISMERGGYQLISQRENSSIKLWHFEPKQSSLSLSYEFGRHSSQIIAVTGSPDGQFLAGSEMVEQRSYIKIWQLSTGQVYRTLFGHRRPVKALAIHLGNRCFIASGSHKIKLWDLQTGESWLTLFGHKADVSCLTISGDGQTLISGSQDKTLRTWNLNRGDLCHTFTGHRGTINIVILSENGEIAISGSADKTIKLWELKTGKLLQTLTGHLGSVSTLRLAYPYLLSGDDTGRIYQWELQTGKLLHILTAHQQTIQAIALSSDGQRLVSGCVGGKVQLWSDNIVTQNQDD